MASVTALAELAGLVLAAGLLTPFAPFALVVVGTWWGVGVLVAGTPISAGTLVAGRYRAAAHPTFSWERAPAGNTIGPVRLRVALVCLVALALPLSAGAAPAFKVTFTAAKHTPRVNERWPWSIKVTTNAGKLLPARISAVVVDPIGGVHPVEFGCCKKFVTNVKINGTFQDWVKFPLAAKGYRVTFRVTVKTTLGTRAVSYWIKTI